MTTTRLLSIMLIVVVTLFQSGLAQFGIPPIGIGIGGYGIPGGYGRGGYGIPGGYGRGGYGRGGYQGRGGYGGYGYGK